MPWGTHTGPSLWVAPLSRTALAWLGTIGTEHPWRAACLESRGGRRGSEGPGNSSPLLRLGLTWRQGHGVPLLLVPSKQRCPVRPGGQKQLPCWGWQVPPWRHWQSWAQLAPQCPRGHAAGDKVGACLAGRASPPLSDFSAPSIAELFSSALVSPGAPRL